MFQKFIAQQLAKPSGWFGRIFTARWLEKNNAGMNALTLQCLHLQSEAHLLEVGFGSGYLLEKVLRDGLCARVAGVDISHEMVAYATARFKSYIDAGRAHIQYADVEALPFSDANFTAVCSVNTLYFWPSAIAGLKECRRVLQPGGRLVLCINSKEDLALWPGHAHGFALYSLEDVTQFLHDADFDDVQISRERDKKQGVFYCLTASVKA
ncbi:class I SAM-dependent methyltransferase [Undibacterium flavidum]|uniref:Class I SAM-dependent methyltransferase n=1 Tax=Undibacterium flavidum TaxID=2762297 RepID=A0ABR6YDE1_9BURK|nr:class I SAM-dependent methyltransferase [Undibacterium flavidum]MBC3874547.1 class I SAM-dependent methyltransferase [Undibacterium flavidum]